MTGIARKCIEEMGEELVRQFAGAPNGVCQMIEHGALGLTGAGAADLNYVLLTAEAEREEFDNAIAAIRDRGINAVLIVEEGAAQVCEWAEQVAQPAGQAPIMERKASLIVPRPGLTARRAQMDEISLVNAVAADAFSLPLKDVNQAYAAEVFAPNSLDAWVVEEEGELIGCGIFVRTDDLVGIYTMGTAKAHRRKGVGRAVLEHAMAHYQDDGVTRFTLGATEAGYPLYQKTGFVTISQPHIFIVGESTQFS